MRTRRSILVAAVAITAAFLSEAVAGSGGPGSVAVALGDLDGDGSPEFALGSWRGLSKIGPISAKTGKILWACPGSSVAPVPDQDGDGGPDVIVGEGIADRMDEIGRWATIRNGKTGTAIRTLELGPDDKSKAAWMLTEGMHALGDVDGDGKDDFLMIRVDIGAPGERSGGWCNEARACVVSIDGKIVADLKPRVDTKWRTVLAAPASDVDGDGRTDLFVAVMGERGKLPVRIVSVTKGVLREPKGDFATDPDAITMLGDIDGDGESEILFGSTLASRGTKESAGEFRILSGKTGGLLRSVKGGGEVAGMGASVAVLGDLDRDGAPDFVAGEPWYKGPKKSELSIGAVRAWSSKAGKMLWTVKGPELGSRLGTAVAAIGDVDGDGIGDVAATGSAEGPDRAYWAVLSGATGKVISKSW